VVFFPKCGKKLLSSGVTLNREVRTVKPEKVKNATYLAAELASLRVKPSSYCAYVATEACKQGRLYTKAKTQGCNVPDPDGKIQKRADRARAKVTELLSEFKVTVEGNSLYLTAEGACYDPRYVRTFSTLLD
jgi:hypothetical protein